MPRMTMRRNNKGVSEMLIFGIAALAVACILSIVAMTRGCNADTPPGPVINNLGTTNIYVGPTPMGPTGPTTSTTSVGPLGPTTSTTPTSLDNPTAIPTTDVPASPSTTSGTSSTWTSTTAPNATVTLTTPTVLTTGPIDIPAVVPSAPASVTIQFKRR